MEGAWPHPEWRDTGEGAEGLKKDGIKNLSHGGERLGAWNTVRRIVAFFGGGSFF